MPGGGGLRQKVLMPREISQKVLMPRGGGGVAVWKKKYLACSCFLRKVICTCFGPGMTLF